MGVAFEAGFASGSGSGSNYGHRVGLRYASATLYVVGAKFRIIDSEFERLLRNRMEFRNDVFSECGFLLDYLFV